MNDIIKNTESQALVKFVKITDKFMQSVNGTASNLNKLTFSISENWKGAQQKQFHSYMEEFMVDLKVQLSKLNEINQKVTEKAKILAQLENKKLKG